MEKWGEEAPASKVAQSRKGVVEGDPDPSSRPLVFWWYLHWVSPLEGRQQLDPDHAGPLVREGWRMELRRQTENN